MGAEANPDRKRFPTEPSVRKDSCSKATRTTPALNGGMRTKGRPKAHPPCHRHPPPAHTPALPLNRTPPTSCDPLAIPLYLCCAPIDSLPYAVSLCFSCFDDWLTVEILLLGVNHRGNHSHGTKIQTRKIGFPPSIWYLSNCSFPGSIGGGGGTFQTWDWVRLKSWRGTDG